jgi:hypothetical protein
MQELFPAIGKAILQLPLAVKKSNLLLLLLLLLLLHFTQTVTSTHSLGVSINHNEHKIRHLTFWSLPYLKQSEVPVEGPNIIYEVLAASTALQRGIDPLGKAFS